MSTEACYFDKGYEEGFSIALDGIIKLIDKKINAANFSQQSHKIYGMKQLRDDIARMKRCKNGR